MSVKETDISEAYVLLAQVLVEDDPLRVWFLSLDGLPANRRVSELGRIAAKLRSDGQGALAEVVASLNSAELYGMLRAVTEALDR